MKIGIVYDSHKTAAVDLAVEVADWFRKKGHKVLFETEKEYLSIGLGLDPADAIVTFGGDGLVLHIANAVAGLGIPILRVNFGYVGFLTNIEPREVFAEMEKFLNGGYEPEARTRIAAEVWHGGNFDPSDGIVTGGDLVKTVDALNELVIGGITRTVSLKLLVKDGKSLAVEARGDGAIFSTMTGSTGYNLNAGGPILSVDTVFAVTANNCVFRYYPPSPNSKLTNAKSFVPSFGSTIFGEVINQEELNLPYLIADGNDDYRLKAGDRVAIKRSAQRTLFLEKKKAGEKHG